VAQFLFANAFRHRLRASPILRHLVWGLEGALIGGVLGLIRLLPADAASALGRKLGGAIGPRLAKHRHVRRNLEHAFPRGDDAWLEAVGRQVWENAGAVMAELAKLNVICAPGRKAPRLEVVTRGEHEALGRGTSPAVFVAAHQANWEVAAAAIVQAGLPMLVPYTPIANPWLDRRLARYRRALGCRLVPRSVSMKALLQEIHAGRSIAFVMDQRVDSGAPVALFGQPKSTTLVPARLALHFGCELVPVRIERRRGARFRVTFHPPVRPANPGAPVRAQAEDMTRQVNGYFERWIGERPGEWLCTKRRWPKRRDGEPSEDVVASVTS